MINGIRDYLVNFVTLHSSPVTPPHCNEENHNRTGRLIYYSIHVAVVVGRYNIPI